MRIVLLIFALFSWSVCAAEVSVLREWPIEDGGRVKPIDTFARENVLAITGTSRDAIATMLEWLDDTSAAKNKPIIYVPNIALREQLHLSSDHVSADELEQNPAFRLESAELIRRKAQDKTFKLSKLQQAEVDLRGRLEMLDQVFSNASLRAIVTKWRAGEVANSNHLMRLEVIYNQVTPFRIVWIVYLMAVGVLVFDRLRHGRDAPVTWRFLPLIFGFGIVLHMAAFAWRCTITGFAPVTNIYETLVWVGLVSSIISLVIYLLNRQRMILVVGVLVAAIATIFADAIPPQFGSSIKPLPPVLRNNFWLTIHVLTIVSSYAAFALAMVLGNIILAQHARRGVVASATMSLLDRTIQIGVVLVAAGTILGGLWADVSWGRFWGWDPKEVWALIILLTYLALLHARLAKWIGDFGMAIGAVLAWATVLMSWYGVNFILGVGLHSYGFGAGGEAYIGGFLLMQVLYIATIVFIRRIKILPA